DARARALVVAARPLFDRRPPSRRRSRRLMGTVLYWTSCPGWPIKETAAGLSCPGGSPSVVRWCDMNVINPFIGSVLQSPQVQRQQADAKASQVRRAQELARNVAAESDRYTHTVESPEALKPVHDER